MPCNSTPNEHVMFLSMLIPHDMYQAYQDSLYIVLHSFTPCVLPLSHGCRAGRTQSIQSDGAVALGQDRARHNARVVR